MRFWIHLCVPQLELQQQDDLSDNQIQPAPFAGETWAKKPHESKAISVLMAHVSIKINGACLVSGGVNSPIQFPPGVELHRQGLQRAVCVCVRMCVSVLISHVDVATAAMCEIVITASIKLKSATSKLYFFIECTASF